MQLEKKKVGGELLRCWVGGEVGRTEWRGGFHGERRVQGAGGSRCELTMI